MLCSLIWELRLNKFKLGLKHFWLLPLGYVKVKGAVDHSTVTRWLCLGCKNFDNQTRYGRSKSMDSNATLLATEANLASCTWRVSGMVGIAQSNTLLHLGKSIPNYASHYQNIAKLLTHLNDNQLFPLGL